MNTIVSIQHREAVTTSLKISEVFGKRHDRVLESIRKITSDLPMNSAPIFREATYEDEQGKPRPMYEMNRDAFSLLAMGFTGKKALNFKLKFIEAFNRMGKALLNQQNLSWKEHRAYSHISRHSETDAIARFVAYASEQGSQHAKLYFMNITKMTHKALNLVRQAGPQSIRDTLDSMQLAFLTTAEYMIQQILEDGMTAGLYYKDIYKLAGDKMIIFAATLSQDRQHQRQITF